MLAPLIALTLAWDAPPQGAVSFRVWRGIECLATVSEPQAVIQLPASGPHTLTVTAINAAGESPHSAPLHLHLIQPPRTLTIQGSPDLTTWNDLPRPGDQFFRIKIER